MLMLVDYSSLLFRAYHAMPDSVPMQGVYGFLNMLARLIRGPTPCPPTRRTG
jgi:5'-3' exonuclease